jgi:hypothetical protein
VDAFQPSPDYAIRREINSLEGDMPTRDLVYVGLGGRGILFGYGQNSGISQHRKRKPAPTS